MYASIVFISGALLMVLEMTGSRVLAPHLGTSIIVWTSLIGVVLAFLALGAFAGGRLADKRLSAKTLSAILLGASLSTACMALLHPFIASGIATSVSNLYFATLLAAIVLLAVPGFFFGMVSPYVIRLSLNSISTSGATIGRLYALSTAGSILGTFLGGFVLISFFGSTQILFGISVAMLLLSMLAFRQQGFVQLIILLPLCGVTVASSFLGTPLAADGKPALIESPYNVLVVLQERQGENPLRTLATDPGGYQSAMYVNDPTKLALQYTRFFRLGSFAAPHAKSVLMLGGGAYSVPKWLLTPKSGLNHEELQVDVVELDPAITQVAFDRFALPKDQRLNIFHEDARRFLNRNKKVYDLLFVDVFGSHYSVPFHMGTVEAAHEMRKAIAPKGALVMNVIGALKGRESLLFQSIYASLKTAFPSVHVFAVQNPNALEQGQNLMIVALPEKDEELEEAFIQEAAFTYGEATSIEQMLGRKVDISQPLDVPPLEDNFAPVERYNLPFLTRFSS